MLYILWNICAFTITVGILVTIHEIGHFVTARLCKVTVQRFSIGFGYSIWKYKDKRNTEYVISAIPLGGYVKMLSKNDISTFINYPTSKKYKTFEETATWHKACIIAAGPLFNIIFSFLIYWSIFMVGISTYRPIISGTIPNSIMSQNNIAHGEIQSINNIKTPDWESVRLILINQLNCNKKNIFIDILSTNSSQIERYSIDLTNWTYEINTHDVITSIGIIPLPAYTIKPILSKVQKNSAAMKAGLKIGDKIISINDQIIHTWEQLVEYIKKNPNTNLKIFVKRENKILTFTIKPDKKILKNNTSEGYIGVSPTYFPISKEFTIKHQFNPIIAIQKSIEKIWRLICLTYNMLYKLIIGDIKLNNLGGPISIAQGAREASKYGFTSYLIFLSLISINLGIINLLPLPILDGGWLCLLIIEELFGKIIAKKIEKYTYHLGIILLILLTFLAIFNDLSKL